MRSSYILLQVTIATKNIKDFVLVFELTN